MRSVFALAAFVGAATLAQSQPKQPEEGPPPRYGVSYRAKAYPQATAKQTVESVIAAVDSGEFDYLVAHLLDPAFADARIADRARQFEPTMEAQLSQLRVQQQQRLNEVLPENRIPNDAAKFRERIAAEARTAAFRSIVRNVQAKLTDDPEVMKDIRRFNREGMFPEGGESVQITVPEIKDRGLFLKRIGNRWFIENRQVEDKAPEPKKE